MSNLQMLIGKTNVSDSLIFVNHLGFVIWKNKPYKVLINKNIMSY
jgi:hypothetical protein